MNRVVMVVNNPASNDYRVVKSAEALAAAGYDCHVLGVLRPGFEALEVANGVTYHRVRLKTGLGPLLIGHFPKLAPYVYTSVASDANAGDSGASAGRVRAVPVFKATVKVLLIAALAPVAAIAGLVAVMMLPFALAGYLAYTLLRTLSRNGSAKRVAYSLQAPQADRRPRLLTALGKVVKSDLARVQVLRRRAEQLVRRVLRIDAVGIVSRQASRLLTRVQSALRTRLAKYLSKLAPQVSPIGVRYLQGRYLASWYAPLVSLRPDALHAHELWSLEACALAADATGARLVYDSHELEAHRNNDWCHSSNRVRVAYEQRYIHRASAVIAVSGGCANTIRELYGLPEVHLLRNTPILGALAPCSTNLREWAGLEEATPLMVYTGSVTINRGLELVLRALQQLGNFHLVTVGPVNVGVEMELDCLASELGVSERFHKHPKVPPHELIDLISSADLAVIPIRNACLSYYHCLPNKLFEAAFAGLPIVASDLPDMREFILGNDLGRVFECDNVPALVDAISTTYDARPSAAEREQKFSALRARHCFETERRVLIEIYAKLLAGSSIQSDECRASRNGDLSVHQS